MKVSRTTWTLLLSILYCSFLLAPDAHAVTVAGRTPGTFQVSSTGSARYSIPIWAPSGPAGLHPNISLVYDNRSGNGPEGVGWSVSGMGAITRCAKTVAQDGAAAPVAAAVSDGYCVNGQRLRLTSGTYGLAGSTYQTEVADFTQVKANGTAGNGPQYFIAKGPDGTTYTYGQDGASNSVITDANGTALSWLLSQVTNPAGSSYTVSYASLQGTAVPHSVSWSIATAGSTGAGDSIVFNYGTNTLVVDKYDVSTHVVNPDLLTSIEVLSVNAVVKNYILSYQVSPTTGASRLSQVQECSNSTQSNCLQPTVITYQSGAAGLVNVSETVPAGSWENAQYDFNGDGLSDISYWSNNSLYVALNTGAGFSTPINTGISCSTVCNSQVAFGDVLNTGRDGILANNGGTFYYYQYQVASQGFTSVSTGLAYNSSYREYLLADVSGNGLPDLLAVNGFSSVVTTRNTSAGGTGSSVSFSSTWTTVYSWTLSDVSQVTLLGNSTLNDGALKKIDFNGDGRQDVFVQISTSKWNKVDGFFDYYYNYELLSNGSGAQFTATALPVSGYNEDSRSRLRCCRWEY